MPIYLCFLYQLFVLRILSPTAPGYSCDYCLNPAIFPVLATRHSFHPRSSGPEPLCWDNSSNSSSSRSSLVCQLPGLGVVCSIRSSRGSTPATERMLAGRKTRWGSRDIIFTDQNRETNAHWLDIIWYESNSNSNQIRITMSPIMMTMTKPLNEGSQHPWPTQIPATASSQPSSRPASATSTTNWDLWAPGGNHLTSQLTLNIKLAVATPSKLRAKKLRNPSKIWCWWSWLTCTYNHITGHRDNAKTKPGVASI